MSKIVGNVVGIPNPQSDFNQNDATKADYIRNKPTTLSGYGITDAYTKSEVDKKISSGGGGGGVPSVDPNFEGKVTIDGVELYVDEYGGFNIEKPEIMRDDGIPNVGGCLSIDNGELLFNGMPVGAGGESVEIKDLTTDLTYNPLTETEKANFMRNTGLDKTLGDVEQDIDAVSASVEALETSMGDIDTALDEIIELQEAHISGDIGDLPLWQGGSY